MTPLRPNGVLFVLRRESPPSSCPSRRHFASHVRPALLRLLGAPAPRAIDGIDHIHEEFGAIGGFLTATNLYPRRCRPPRRAHNVDLRRLHRGFIGFLRRRRPPQRAITLLFGVSIAGVIGFLRRCSPPQRALRAVPGRLALRYLNNARFSFVQYRDDLLFNI